MSMRRLLTGNAWKQIAAILALFEHPAGSPPVLSNWMLIEVDLSVARPGIPWRDLPSEFGRWEGWGVWRKLWDHVQREAFTVAKDILIDSTMVRAHQHAAGALKNPVAMRPRRWDAFGADLPRTSILTL